MRQGHGRLCASGRFARSMHLGLTVTQRGLAFLRIGAGSHHSWDAGTLVTQTCREGAKAPAHRRGREAGFWVTRCGASRLAGRRRGPRTRRVATATRRCACVSGGEGNVWRTVGAATLPPRASRRCVSRWSAANTGHGARVILGGAGPRERAGRSARGSGVRAVHGPRPRAPSRPDARSAAACRAGPWRRGGASDLAERGQRSFALLATYLPPPFAGSPAVARRAPAGVSSTPRGLPRWWPNAPENALPSAPRTS